jgi:hypothetical protein
VRFATAIDDQRGRPLLKPESVRVLTNVPIASSKQADTDENQVDGRFGSLTLALHREADPRFSTAEKMASQ